MCGRGACTLSADRCKRIAGGRCTKARGLDRLRPKYNLSPQSLVPVVRHCRESCPSEFPKGAREVCAMRWGLVPAFAKKAEDFDAFRGGISTFNARVESAESSGIWRRLVDSRRAVVLFDGFYEWKTVGKVKTPIFIRNRDDYDGHVIPALPRQDAKAEVHEKTKLENDEVLLPEKQASVSLDDELLHGPRYAPLLLAGLYDTWKGAEGTDDPLESVTILTMDTDGTPMFEVHDRMPIFLDPDAAALWLDTEARFSEIIGSVVKGSREHAQKRLLLYEVSTLVSNGKNESPDCIVPKRDYDAKTFSKGLGRFFQKPEKSAGATAAATPAAKRPAEESLESVPGEVKAIRID